MSLENRVHSGVSSQHSIGPQFGHIWPSHLYPLTRICHIWSYKWSSRDPAVWMKVLRLNCNLIGSILRKCPSLEVNVMEWMNFKIGTTHCTWLIFHCLMISLIIEEETMTLKLSVLGSVQLCNEWTEIRTQYTQAINYYRYRTASPICLRLTRPSPCSI